MSRTVEIRNYILKPGAGPAFEHIFRERGEPMLHACGMDVVAFGRSAHDENAYYLIRAFDSLDHLTKSEDEFYGADAWRPGPREEVLNCIESYQDTVLTISIETVDSLRRDLGR